MTEVLITGDEGFVGRAFRREGAARGWNITGVDLKSGRDALTFFDVMRSVKYDLVIHLAALVGGRVQIEQGPFTLATRDLQLDAALFRWAVETEQGCPIVYFSSSAAYPIHLQGRYEHRTLREEHIDLDDVASPDLSYGWTKLTGEKIADWAKVEHGLDVKVFRPFSGYGADQDLDYPFPSFILRAVNHASPFKVWGDGTQVRDFIHISDVVQGVIAALDADWRGPLNLGTGVATSFNELASLVMAAAGYSAPVEHVTAAPTGVHYRVADTTNFAKVYVPRITVQDGIERALKEIQ